MGEGPSQEPRKVVVEGPATGFRTKVDVGGHQLVVDEPIPVGGSDQGPSPYEMLLAGLGACTAMTLRLYAEQKQLPLAGVTVTLRHSKIHAADCATCETKEGRLDRIERTIALEGELDEAQRARLLAIADKCPVHQTLQNKIQVNTRFG